MSRPPAFSDHYTSGDASALADADGSWANQTEMTRDKRQIVFTIDHRFAFSDTIVLSAPTENLRSLCPSIL